MKKKRKENFILSELLIESHRCAFLKKNREWKRNVIIVARRRIWCAADAKPLSTVEHIVSAKHGSFTS